ncbi:MAG: hypothetical protein R3F56_13925 [Planctomycetota bacterium]
MQANRAAKALPLFEEVSKLQGSWAFGASISQAADMIGFCRRELGLPEALAPGVGLGPRGAPKLQPGKPILLTDRTLPPAPWWEVAWRVYRNLGLGPQILIPLALLSGLLALLRKIVAK